MTWTNLIPSAYLFSWSSQMDVKIYQIHFICLLTGIFRANYSPSQGCPRCCSFSHYSDSSFKADVTWLWASSVFDGVETEQVAGGWCLFRQKCLATCHLKAKFWQHWTACGILVPPPGIEPVPLPQPASAYNIGSMESQSPDHQRSPTCFFSFLKSDFES